MTTTKTAIVWTKTNSPASRQAVAHLQRMGYNVEERNIVYDNPWNMDKLKEAIPGVKSVPQIVIDGTLIGGLKELMARPDAKLAKKSAMPTTKLVNDAAVARKSVHTQAKATQKTALDERIAARKSLSPTEQHAILTSRKEQRQLMEPTNSVISPEQAAGKHAVNVAERASADQAKLTANATARAEKAAAYRARVDAAKQAQRDALVHKG